MNRHRSTAQPLVVDESAPVAPAHRPTRWTVRTVRRIGFTAVWLAVALSLLATLVAYRTAVASSRQAAESSRQAAQVDRRLSALEDYVDGKGAQRDRENAQLRQQITDAVCSVLDELPAGGRLDTIRASYGCGQGLPASGTVDRTTPRTAPAPAGGPPAASGPVAGATPAGSPPPAAPPVAPAPASPSEPSTATPGPLCVLLGLLCPTP